jgi:chorismate dehydratase
MNANQVMPRHRLGVVSFLNTLPLIDGLDALQDVRLVSAVPSELIRLLLSGEVDAALCSIVDYQMSPEPLKILPAGLLGCDGSTMTVRLFSQIPTQRITRIHCDTDSHTSVMLLRVLLHELHHIRPELVNFDARQHRTTEGDEVQWPEAMLLIGDKVVTDSTPAIRYPYQLDLGAEWKELTGLPFVFATWVARREAETASIAAVLDHQRRHNKERFEHFLRLRAVDHGWPIDLARSYLRDMLRFDWTDDMVRGVERFFALAHAMGLIVENRPLLFDPI